MAGGWVAGASGAVAVISPGCGLADICATTVWATLVESTLGSVWLADGALQANIARIKPSAASHGALFIIILFSSIVETTARIGERFQVVSFNMIRRWWSGTIISPLCTPIPCACIAPQMGR